MAHTITSKLSLDRWKGKLAVITGASSGLGAALSVALVQKGINVVGIARRIDRLHDVGRNLRGLSAKFYAYQCDITVRKEVKDAFDWIDNQVDQGVAILINCAGVYRDCSLINGSTDHFFEIFNTNVLGLCMVTREALKLMEMYEVAGHVIHLNSAMGHAPPKRPEGAMYIASKAALTSLTEGLRQELRKERSAVKITSLSPGFVETETALRIISDNNTDGLEIRARLNPEDIIDAVLYVLSTPPHVQIHELTIKPVGETF